MHGRRKSIWALALAALLSLSLVACGGGGGGGVGGVGGGDPPPPPPATNLSGVAAAGAAIVGTVFVKDSLGAEKQTLVEAADNGAYDIDVSGMTPPFKLKVVGSVGNTRVTYCSLATERDVGGTVNITPFTDLMVANIAGQVAANFYSSGNPSLITTAAIQAQVEDLSNKLLPVLQAMGIGSSVDLLRQSFTPGVDALDQMLDIIKVTVTPETAAVEIKNIVDNSTLIGTAGGALTGALGAPTPADLSDLDKIRAGITGFATRFATTLPSPADPALRALFAGDFLEGGLSLDQFLQELTTDGMILGLKVGGISFVPGQVDLAGGSALVTFVVTLPGENNLTETVMWWFARDQSGAWKARGDQRLVSLDFAATATVTQLSLNQQNSNYGTGLQFHIGDDMGTSGAATAVVRGPGLPAQGVTLYNQAANPQSSNGGQFSLDPSGIDQNNVVWLNWDHYSPSEKSANDAAILAAFPAGANANLAYTVELYSQVGALLGTYTEIVSYRPYTLAELVTAQGTRLAPFATVTQPSTLEQFATFQMNVANTVTWTLAPGTTADWIHVSVGNGVDNYDMGMDLLPGQTSATGTITAPSGFTPNGGGIWLSVEDALGRILSTSISAW
ncbi:MAG: hypothetical protein ACYDA8_17905 [Deferrisomatales bacterium]